MSKVSDEQIAEVVHTHWRKPATVKEISDTIFFRYRVRLSQQSLRSRLWKLHDAGIIFILPNSSFIKRPILRPKEGGYPSTTLVQHYRALGVYAKRPSWIDRAGEPCAENVA